MTIEDAPFDLDGVICACDDRDPKRKLLTIDDGLCLTS